MGRIKAEKKEEFVDYIKQVKTLIGTYLPLDAAKMQAAHEAGNVSLSRPGTGEAGLVFKSYSLPGDSMTLDFSTETHKLASLAVNSYLGDPSSAVTLAVQFASLPDGTSYPAQETINAAAKGLKLAISEFELPEDFTVAATVATGERLQKLLANAGHGSRREIEQWIRDQRLTLAGRIAQLGDRAEAGADIRLDGQPLRQRASGRAHGTDLSQARR